MTVIRPPELAVGEARLPLPIFFPSISTVKTTLTPQEYLAILHSLRNVNRQFLVSAFDLSNSVNGDELIESLMTARDAGMTILMDSGNYESYWKNKSSDWSQFDFHTTLQRFDSSFAFGFDEQNPPIDNEAHIQLLVEQWQRDQAAAGKRLIVPIVHGSTDALPTLCARVAQETKTPMIAVAERRLGDGVFERARSVMTLREKLNRSGNYVGLHLLGTGNPLSIALYSWAGADSFDGLEWCQTVVDHETGLLFHLSQSDFFQHQTAWGESDISFQARTLAHNLTFYTDWVQRLRHAIHAGDVVEFCRFNFPSRIYSQCAATFGWGDPK